jgi:hypothetical protein
LCVTGIVSVILAGSFAIRQSKTILGVILARDCRLYHSSLPCGEQRDRIRSMIQVKMFFNSDFDQLEQAARSWLDGSHGLISEVLNISQCECTNPETNERGVLLTILYREKKGARGEDGRQII